MELNDTTLEEGDKLEGKRVSTITRMIQNHYRKVTQVKTASQVKREQLLLPGISFNRWHCLIAAFLIQCACGSVSAWSIFNKPIDQLIYGEFRSISPIIFYITHSVYGICAAIMGPWEERHGPMKSCFLGATLFLMGSFTTALALYLKQMWLVFIGSGVLVGLGFGLTYIAPVPIVQKWYPDKRGFASGLSVCGFGAGSIAISKAQIPLTELVGLPLTFVVFGSCIFVIISLSGMVLRTPTPGYPDHQSKEAKKDCEAPNVEVSRSSALTLNRITSQASQDLRNVINETPQSFPPEISVIDAITSKDYKLMYVMFFSNIVLGFTMLSNLANIATDVFGRSPEEASTVVAVTGCFNVVGRVTVSAASDLIGRRSSFLLILSLQMIIVATFIIATFTRTYWAFLMSMWVLTICFGTGFSLIPAFLAETFGSVNVGPCHGVILTAESIAGVASGLLYTTIFNTALSFGYTQQDPFPYNLNMPWIFLMVATGWTSTLFVTPTPNDTSFIRRITPKCLL